MGRESEAIARGLIDEAARLATHARALNGKSDAANLAARVLTFAVVEIMAVADSLMKRPDP